MYKYSPKWKGKDCWYISTRMVISPSYKTLVRQTLGCLASSEPCSACVMGISTPY